MKNIVVMHAINQQNVTNTLNLTY